MRHTLESPLRWADMDLLGHINNVTFVDLLQEARVAFFAEHRVIHVSHDVPEGILVVRHEVDFLAPLSFRTPWILIDTWVAEIRAGSFTLAHELYHSDHNGRTVYARASTVLAPFVFATESPRRLSPEEREFLTPYLAETPKRTAINAAGSSRHAYPLQLRWSEIDPYRHVNNVHYYEYFQESRVAYLRNLHTHGEQWNQNVIARMDVDYVRPMHYRRTPYDVHAWVSGIGTKSYTIAQEIRDGDQVLARSQVVMVTFDIASQAAAPMTPDQRAALERQLPTG